MGRKLAIFFGALAAVAVAGLADYATGTDVRAVLFYVLPIMLVAWFVGRRAVIAVAVAASVAWIWAEFSLKHYTNQVAMVWNPISNLIVFMLVGLLISTVRKKAAEQRAASDKIRELLANEERISRTDPLTGLPNGREFLERLEPEIARCRRDGSALCLVYLDLDNFKRVNDLFGHNAGDDVLRRVADAMRKQLRASDVPARLGGDEFAALLWQTEAEDARTVSQRLVDAVKQVGADYAGTELGASAGIVWFDTPPAEAREVVKRADDTMYDAKKSGKSRVILVKATASSA